MQETLVTVAGNVATNVETRETASGMMVRFRFAVTPRRWDRQSESWTDGHTAFYTVFAWRALAANLAGSVTLGEPLLVHGRLRVREETRDGTGEPGGFRDGRDDPPRRTFVDIEALSVGHDLTRGTTVFRRAPKQISQVAEVWSGRSGPPGSAAGPGGPPSPARPAAPAPTGAEARPPAAPF
ncbi:single-stranded DNA-binding protein [Streptomyces sp. CAU 1734]|uniref:single-stranded DNA-binding protein n=1 Tax=Streptomyces sp. CAU 1734 TaxID=3140360 RepID=UPI003261A9A3